MAPSRITRERFETRLWELVQMRDGWLDGDAVVPPEAALSTAIARLLRDWPAALLFPFAYLSPNATLLLEWATDTLPSIEFHFEPLSAHFHAFGVHGDIERDFVLTGADAHAQWGALFEFLVSREDLQSPGLSTVAIRDSRIAKMPC